MRRPADAEHVTSYGGDAFGNGANNLWRCTRCDGVFYTGAPYLEPVLMGLILFDDGGKSLRESWERAAHLYRSQPHCQCEDREAIQNPDVFAGSFRRGEPPIDWLDMVREIRESLDKKNEDES